MSNKKIVISPVFDNFNKIVVSNIELDIINQIFYFQYEIGVVVKRIKIPIESVLAHNIINLENLKMYINE